MHELYFTELPEMPECPEYIDDRTLFGLFKDFDIAVRRANEVLWHNVCLIDDGLFHAETAKRTPEDDIAAYYKKISAESIKSGMVDYRQRLEEACTAVSRLQKTLDVMRRIV